MLNALYSLGFRIRVMLWWSSFRDVEFLIAPAHLEKLLVDKLLFFISKVVLFLTRLTRITYWLSKKSFVMFLIYRWKGVIRFLSLTLRKLAFDRLHWSFISGLFSILGIPFDIHNLTVSYITTTSDDINWNGCPTH